MNLTWRPATAADLALLADWNHQLIRDEGHRNAMTVAELSARMASWLQGEYQAVLFFADGEPIAYALYKSEPTQLYLRQFFVRRDRRRLGFGRAAFALLRREVWPAGVRLTVEALCAHPPAVAFWRSVGYKDYAITFELLPE